MNKLLVVLNVITFSSVLVLLACVLTGGASSNTSLSTAPTVDNRQELIDRLVTVELTLQSMLTSTAQSPASTQVFAKANAEPGKTSPANYQASDASAQHAAARTLTDTIIQSGNMTAKQSIELRGALGQLQDRQQARLLMKEIVIAINSDQLKLDPSAFL